MTTTINDTPPPANLYGPNPCPLLRLHAIIDYDPETGAMTWKPRPWNPAWTERYAGAPALASLRDHTRPELGRHGYVFGIPTLAHRVAFALARGQWPKGEVTARNGDLSDLRAENLAGPAKTEPRRKRKEPAKVTPESEPQETFEPLAFGPPTAGGRRLAKSFERFE